MPDRVAPTPDGRHWVFWDEDCPFCRRTAAWIRRRDRAGRFQTHPCQSAPSPPFPEALRPRCRETVWVVHANGTVLRTARAALLVLRHLGWGPVAVVLSVPPLLWLVEAGYWFVARNRRLLGRFLFTREQ